MQNEYIEVKQTNSMSILLQVYAVTVHSNEIIRFSHPTIFKKLFIQAYDVILEKRKTLYIQEECHRITIIGAGGSVCPDLVSQLLMTKELWLTNGIIINLYDKPGCFFKLKRIHKDVGGVGAGLNRVNVLDNVPDGLIECHTLIYLDSFSR